MVGWLHKNMEDDGGNGHSHTRASSDISCCRYGSDYSSFMFTGLLLMGLPANLRVYGFGLILGGPTTLKCGVKNFRALVGLQNRPGNRTTREAHYRPIVDVATSAFVQYQFALSALR
jgi:hypothetical protein